MTKRRKARELALQFLYELDGTDENLSSRTKRFYEEFASESLLRDGFIKKNDDLYRKKDVLEIYDFFYDIVFGVSANLEKIDGTIRNLSKNWVLERMARIDRNILRLSVYEILMHPETPKNVIINEAIEIAKKFGNGDSPSFINGILDATAKKTG